MEKSSARLKLLALLVALMFAALSARLWYLQVLAFQTFRDAANTTSLKWAHTPPPRGRILDAHGIPLVDNRRSLQIVVEQQRLGDNPEAVLLRLSKVLGMPINEIRNALANKQYYHYQPIPVKTDVSLRQVEYIAEHRDRFPGVSWQESSVPEYPQGSLAAHILGYVGQITASEIKSNKYKGYGPSDLVGQSGLEAEYERWLRGTSGLQKYLVDPANRIIRTLGGRAAAPGDDVRLYLDLHLQRIVERDLREGVLSARRVTDTSTGALLRATGAAAVVLDPSTGGVEAMASYPSFNPSWYVGGLSEKHQKELSRPSAMYPLLNRTTQAALAPGSTFKPFIALSALKHGLASLGGSYPCPPAYVYGTDTAHPFHNWSSVSLGYLNLAEALRVSCDTVFYRFGGEYYDRFYRSNPLSRGSEPLQQDLARDFGFGRPTGIDLPSESSGVVPTAAWKQRYTKEHPDMFLPDQRVWLPADDINMSIGQGFVSVTPLQLATAYSAIANGGRLCEPRIAEDVQTDSGKVVRQFRGHCTKLPYPETDLAYIRNALTGVTSQSGGTAYYAFQGFPFSKVTVAGKTGTAQRAPLQDTSWFAALVGPVANPQHVIVVMVEQGGHGSTTAAPITRSIIEDMYHLQAGGHIGQAPTD